MASSRGTAGASPTRDEVRAALAAIVRAGPAALWGSETRGLFGIPAVRRRIADGADAETPVVVRAVLEAGIEQVSSHQYRHLLTTVLGLDSEPRLSARQRRERAGEQFRGGTTPVAWGTIRQYHEPRALDELAVALLALDVDGDRTDLGPATVLQSLGEGPSLTCFVIGPIGSSHAEIGSDARQTYEESLGVMADVIEPACEAVGLSPVRADSLARAGEITSQIFRRLRDDDVVIADLTDANANVMYELGMRHTRDKLTIQIGEYDRLPFDVSTIRTIQFSRSAVGLIRARDQLIRLLKAGLDGAYDRLTPTTLWNETAAAAPEAQAESESAGAESPTSGDDNHPVPLGFVDILAKGEGPMEEIPSAIEAVGEQVTALGALADQSVVQLHQSDAAGKGMRGRLQVITGYAVSLERIADGLEVAVEHYSSVLVDVSAAVLALIEKMERDPEGTQEELTFGMITRRSAQSSRDATASLAGLVGSIESTAGASRVLKEPSRRLTRSLERFVKDNSVADEWDRRLQAHGVPVPPPEWSPPSSDEDQDAAS